MRLLTPEELAEELEKRGCRHVRNIAGGYAVWITRRGDAFSVPPPEEIADGTEKYPDWMLDDLIERVGLSPGSAPPPQALRGANDHTQSLGRM